MPMAWDWIWTLLMGKPIWIKMKNGFHIKTIVIQDEPDDFGQ